MKAILIFIVALTALQIAKGKEREEIDYCFSVLEDLEVSIEEIKVERIESCTATNETVKLQHRKKICGCAGAAHMLLERISEGCYERWKTVPHKLIISVMSMYGKCLKKAKDNGNDKDENKSTEEKKKQMIDEEKFMKPINEIIENFSKKYKLESDPATKKEIYKIAQKSTQKPTKKLTQKSTQKSTQKPTQRPSKKIELTTLSETKSEERDKPLTEDSILMETTNIPEDTTTTMPEETTTIVL